MEINKILQADYLDLVFDNRNKNYGSYELRKHYHSRALKAFGCMLLAVSLGVAIPAAISKMLPKSVAAGLVERIKSPVVIADVRPFEIKPEKKIIPKPAEHPAASIKKTVAVLPPKIVADNKVPPAVAPPKITDDAAPGAVTNPGNNGKEVASSTVVPVGAPGAGVVPGKGTAEAPVVNDAPLKFADVMPEYPGGLEALSKYLQRNLHYPAEANEKDIQGRVMVRFVVNEAGRVEDATILKAIGGGCEKEALRVVNAMKGWKPGMVQGKAVKVYYTLPITFKKE